MLVISNTNLANIKVLCRVGTEKAIAIHRAFAVGLINWKKGLPMAVDIYIYIYIYHDICIHIRTKIHT